MPKKITEDGEVLDIVTHEVIAMAPPFWKTPFNHNTDHESTAFGLTCKDPTKTQQQLAAECDINNILRKFQQTGELRLTGDPQYGDADDRDLQDLIVTKYQVDQAWEALSAEVRNVLKNPETFASYVEHCLNTGDLDPLRNLGLAKPKEPKQTAQEPPKMPGSPPGGSPAPDPAQGASDAPKN